MADVENIGLLYLEQAKNHPEKAAIITKDRVISHAALANAAMTFAMHMRARGVRRGQLIGLDMQNSAMFSMASILASALLGVCWTRISPHILGRSGLGIRHVFYCAPASYPTYFRGAKVDRSWFQLPKGADPKQGVKFDGNQSPRDIFTILGSSGTTGKTKIIPMTYEKYLRRISIEAGIRSDEQAITVDFFNPSSSLGARWRLATLIAGGTIVESKDIDFWREHGVSRVTGSPVQALRWIKQTNPTPGALINTFKLTGAKLNPEFLPVLRRYFKNIDLSYGSSEGGRVCGRVLGPDDTPDGKLGQIMSDAQLEILDDAGNPLPAGTTGIIRLKTPSTIRQYVNDKKATEEFLKDGWFYPGDLGYLTDDNQLVVTGRINDQISLGGIKLDAVMIDHAVQSAKGVDDAICFELPNNEGVTELALIVRKTGKQASKTLAKTIRETCVSKINKDATPKQIFFLDEVPRTETGKPARHKAHDMIEGHKPF